MPRLKHDEPHRLISKSEILNCEKDLFELNVRPGRIQSGREFGVEIQIRSLGHNGFEQT